MRKPNLTADQMIAEHHAELAVDAELAELDRLAEDSYCCEDCDGPRPGVDLYSVPEPGQTWVLVLDGDAIRFVTILRPASGAAIWDGSFWVLTAEGREVLAWGEDLVPPL